MVGGQIDVEGGWRVYSSGPGILVRLVRESLLGLRVRAYGLEIDPVLTARFDGIGAAVRLGTTSLRVRFQVVSGGGAVTCVSVEGTALAHQRLLNPYRPGGVVVDRATLDRLADGAELRVSIG